MVDLTCDQDDDFVDSDAQSIVPAASQNSGSVAEPDEEVSVVAEGDSGGESDAEDFEDLDNVEAVNEDQAKVWYDSVVELLCAIFPKDMSNMYTGYTWCDTALYCFDMTTRVLRHGISNR